MADAFIIDTKSTFQCGHLVGRQIVDRASILISSHLERPCAAIKTNTPAVSSSEKSKENLNLL